MFEARIESLTGNIVNLTQRESDFQVVNITGLNPPNAQINKASVAGMDGTKFNSSKLEDRNIVITLKLNGNVEANRLFLYRHFRTKDWCKFYYKNGTLDVYIEGWVETVECDLFTNDERMQISILCPQPYFKSLDMIIDDVSKVLQKFEFPFAINVDDPIPFSTIDMSRVTNVYNDSESESGLLIDVVFSGNVKKLEIKNTITGKSFTLNYNFIENDHLIINTNKGEKSVTLTRNAIQYNLIPNMLKGSVFFQLALGDNYFSYLADDGASDERISLLFKHYTIYRGV